jgi:ribosomal protein L11 methyltransferase
VVSATAYSALDIVMAQQDGHIEYAIETEPFDIETLTTALDDLSPAGVLEEGSTALVYFAEAKDPGDELREIVESLRQSGAIEDYSIERREIENRNWNEEWERSREVVRVSDRLVVKPSFREYDARDDEIVVVVDPKMSFGTGEHPTTRLCLRVVERLTRPGASVLDLGSGAGTLAIAAILFGAERALAADVDRDCKLNGEENAELNGVSDKIEFLVGDVDSISGTFDLVLANIHKNELLKIAEKLRARCAPHTTVALSGLLLDDEAEIRETYEQAGFTFSGKSVEDEWLAVEFTPGI